MKRATSLFACLAGMFTAGVVPVWADNDLALVGPEVPDFRGDGSELTVEHGQLVLVPVPVSNPTVDTGLVLGEAYYHPQTPEEAATQPPSVTAAGGMYTSSDSKALGVLHQGYGSRGLWRYSLAGGVGNLNLGLVRPGGSPEVLDVDWRLKGNFLLVGMARQIRDGWFLGLFGRNVKADQTLSVDITDTVFDLGNKVSSVGLGPELEYDSRDERTNAYSGRHFKVQALFNEESLGSDRSYQAYSAALRSYHPVQDNLVLAWELEACGRGGEVPLWDGCRVDLRGFSTTDYIGRTTASAQLEARWRLGGRWGVVGFGGVGYARSTFSRIQEREAIPSYGVGLRYMVVPDKRLNVRLDVGRSSDSNALHLSVGESF